MKEIKTWIEETIESNTGKLMAGDRAVAPSVARKIAFEAASRAAAGTRKMTHNARRFELACGVVRHIYAGQRNEEGTWQECCGVALRLVDHIAELIDADDPKA